MDILSKIFSFIMVPTVDKQFKEIKETDYQWGNKEVLKDSVLIWDLENISFNDIGHIMRLSKFTPEISYVVTTQNLSLKNRKKIEKMHFKIMDLHKTISDDKIIKIMKLFKNSKGMILISSDSDFVREASNFIKNNKLHWIVSDDKKKAITMRMDLSNPNLIISSFSKEPKKKKNVVRKEIKITKDQDVYKKLFLNRDRDNLIKNITLYSPLKVKSILEAYLDKNTDFRFSFNNSENKESLELLSFINEVLFSNEEDSFLDFLKNTADYKINLRKVRQRIPFKNFSNIVKRIDNVTKRLSAQTKALKKETFVIYRKNFKGIFVTAGKVFLFEDGHKELRLNKDLKRKFIMPDYTKNISFFDDSEVSIYINFKEERYNLNSFERRIV